MTSPSGRFSLRLWIGLAVLSVGLLEFLEAAGFYDAGRILRWWPALLVALGVLLLSRGLPSGRWFPGALVLLVGSSLLAERLGWLEEGLDKLWPLILVLLGLAIISRGLRRAGEDGGGQQSELSSLAVLAGLKPKITSSAFTGGQVSAFLGSCEVDLTDARLAEEGALLDLFVLMGGIELRIPPGWRVDSKVMPLMGSVEDKTAPSPDANVGSLELRGFVMMGGVVIKN